MLIFVLFTVAFSVKVKYKKAFVFHEDIRTEIVQRDLGQHFFLESVDLEYKNGEKCVIMSGIIDKQTLKGDTLSLSCHFDQDLIPNSSFLFTVTFRKDDKKFVYSRFFYHYSESKYKKTYCTKDVDFKGDNIDEYLEFALEKIKNEVKKDVNIELDDLDYPFKYFQSTNEAKLYVDFFIKYYSNMIKQKNKDIIANLKILKSQTKQFNSVKRKGNDDNDKDILLIVLDVLNILNSINKDDNEYICYFQEEENSRIVIKWSLIIHFFDVNESDSLQILISQRGDGFDINQKYDIDKKENHFIISLDDFYQNQKVNTLKITALVNNVKIFKESLRK